MIKYPTHRHARAQHARPSLGFIKHPVPQSHMTGALLSLIHSSSSAAVSKAHRSVSFLRSVSLSDNDGAGGKQGDGHQRLGSSCEDAHPGCDPKLHLSTQAKYVTLTGCWR